MLLIARLFTPQTNVAKFIISNNNMAINLNAIISERKLN